MSEYAANTVALIVVGAVYVVGNNAYVAICNKEVVSIWIVAWIIFKISDHHIEIFSFF